MADSNKIIAHRCDIEMMLYNDMSHSESTEIPAENIKGFVSDYKYKDNYMPIFWVTLDMSVELYDKFVENQSDGQVYLHIRNYNALEQNAIKKDVIKDIFSYFIPMQYNQSDDVSDDKRSKKMRIYHMTIGLLKKEVYDKFKTTYNSVHPKTTTQDMLDFVMEEANIEESSLITDKIEIDTEYETSFVMPPQDSVANAIDYIFKQEPFYETDFQFFMDLDRTYLLNSTGIAREFSSMPIVRVDISLVTEEELYYDGCGRDTEAGAYVIYVNQNDVEFHINTSEEKNNNQFVGTYTGQVAKVAANPAAKKVNPARPKIVNESGIQLTSIQKTIMENTIITMVLTKKNMDSSTITPDKAYLVDSPNYEQYNGKYLLEEKQEMVIREGEDFLTTTTLRFKRIAAQDQEGETITETSGKA